MSENIISGYEWVGFVPAGICVCDARNLSVISSNAYFDELAGESGESALAGCLGAALKAETVISVRGGGEERHAVARATSCVIGGRAVIVFALVNAAACAQKREAPGGGVIDFAAAETLLDELVSRPDAATTVCSVALSETEDDVCRRVTTILKNCMRHSDVLAKRDAGEFLMIFPQCRAKIVESIMENAQERIDAVNKAEGRKNLIKMRCAIVEVAFSNNQSGEALIDAARRARDEDRGAKF
jgi:hypothetical protein